MFGTSGVRGRIGDEVTCDLALSVGRALGSESTDAGADDGTVVVARDARESGRMLADAAAAGLRECGADVIRLGEAATPTLARSVGWVGADAGLMVTASHNPPQDNGLKLWNPSGQAFDEAQREAIARRVSEREFSFAEWDALGAERDYGEVGERHGTADQRHVEALVGAAASGNLTVAVDVGNGVGQVTAEALRRLGHDVQTLNATRDGSFPSRPSEPTAENCRGLVEFVSGESGRDSYASDDESGRDASDEPGAFDADLGIAHDGDADRMRAVTGDGEFVSGDVLLAVFAREAANPGDEVAVPVDTSLAVADALEAQGVSVTRTRVGDVFVAERASDCGVAFGGEPSGAWIWPGETLCPDGPLAACRLAGLVSRRGSLARLVEEIETYPLRRGNVRTDRKEAVMERVCERVGAGYDDVATLDGVRVETDDGWFLVRASGTEPVVRVTAEARSRGNVEDLFAEARGLVEDCA